MKYSCDRQDPTRPKFLLLLPPLPMEAKHQKNRHLIFRPSPFHSVPLLFRSAASLLAAIVACLFASRFGSGLFCAGPLSMIQGQTSNGVSIGALLTDVLQSLGPVLAILTNFWSNFGHRQRSPSLKRTVDPPQPLQPPQLGKDSNSLGGFGVALLGAGGGFPVACMEIPYEWVHQHMNRIQLEQHCPGNLRSLVSVWHCGIFCHVVRHLTFDRPASRRPPLRGLHWSSIAVLLM